MSIKFRI